MLNSLSVKSDVSKTTFEKLEPIISVKNLFFEYEQTAEDSRGGFSLNDINLDVMKGEFVAVLGHNGSGKSTLAKLFNALLLPTGGNVYVNGLDTGDPANTWDIRRNAGMVFQNPDNQIIATVVEEDVAFGAENLGIDPVEIRKRVDTALKSLGMEPYAKNSPHFLSGGQKQRVAIAGILAMRPSCIILDEPTAMLDPIGRKDVMQAIHMLNRDEGITIVLITHFMDEAVEAGRVVVMDEGKIIMDGVPSEIFSKYEELKAIGLDVPQVTRCAYELRKLGIPLKESIISIEEMTDELLSIYKKR